MKKTNKKLLTFVLYLTICCIVPWKIIETNGFKEEVKRGFFTGIGSKIGEEIFQFLYNYSKKGYNGVANLFRKIPVIGHPRKAGQFADLLWAKVWNKFTTGNNNETNIEHFFTKNSVKKFKNIWKNCVITSWENCLTTPLPQNILLPSLKCFYTDITILISRHYQKNCDEFLSYIDNSDMRYLELIWDITPEKYQKEIIKKYPQIRIAHWYLRTSNINKTDEELYNQKWFEKFLKEAEIDIIKNKTEINDEKMSPSILNDMEGNELYKLFNNAMISVMPKEVHINEKNEKIFYLQTLDKLLPLIEQKVNDDIFKKSFYDKILLYRQLLRDIEVTANEIWSALLEYIYAKGVETDYKEPPTEERVKILWDDTIEYEVKGFTFSFNFDNFLNQLKKNVNANFYKACYEFLNTGKHNSIIKKKIKKITPYDLEQTNNYMDDNDNEEDEEEYEEDEDDEDEEEKEVVTETMKTKKEEKDKNEDQNEWDFEDTQNEDEDMYNTEDEEDKVDDKEEMEEVAEENEQEINLDEEELGEEEVGEEAEDEEGRREIEGEIEKTDDKSKEIEEDRKLAEEETEAEPEAEPEIEIND